MSQLLQSAIEHHQAGRIAEAEKLYRLVLAQDPRQADALHFLGLVALQQGRNEDAVGLITKSIEANRRNPEAHYHLGLAYAGLGRFKEVETHNRRVIALNPNHAPAHLNLGNALRALGQPREAAACYRKAIAIAPNVADPHFNLANVLSELGELDEAIAAYQRALALQPSHLQARHNLALALLVRRRIDPAIAEFHRVVAAKPDFVEALVAGALALQLNGRLADALTYLSRAVTLSPDQDARRMFCECASALREFPPIPGLRDLVIRALDEPWHRPRSLVAFAVLGLLQSNGPATAVLNRFANLESARPGPTMTAETTSSLSQDDLAALADDGLLHAILANAPVNRAFLETALTAARRTLAGQAARDEVPIPTMLHFACALARQCFINEYVFDLDEEDREHTSALRASLSASLAARTQPPPLLVAMAAAYEPLHRIDNADRLLDWTWDASINAVLTQQLHDRTAERTLAQELRALTPITEGVSSHVRAQYEENPYPRWVKAVKLGKTQRLERMIRDRFPLSPFRDPGVASPTMLIAGCGTGQYANEVAQQIEGVQIVALDLSLASLSYAKRNSVQLGLTNIDYAQADIVALPQSGLRFDVIESSGVLHHMEDPFAAWRGLLSMLKPNGLMQLAFYSEHARQAVVAARDMIAKAGFEPTPDGIRAMRRAVRDLPPEAPAHLVGKFSDFFSLSECRDLLFHVQEHRLTLPQIRDFIANEKLSLIGFELSTLATAAAYLKRFPDDPMMTDLDHWDEFEREYPLTFSGMYQFWVQKPA